MLLALDDLPRDPDQLLLMLQQMAEVTAGERSRITSLEIERDTILAERDAARTDCLFECGSAYCSHLTDAAWDEPLGCRCKG